MNGNGSSIVVSFSFFFFFFFFEQARVRNQSDTVNQMKMADLSLQGISFRFFEGQFVQALW